MLLWNETTTFKNHVFFFPVKNDEEVAKLHRVFDDGVTHAADPIFAACLDEQALALQAAVYKVTSGAGALKAARTHAGPRAVTIKLAGPF